MTAEPDLNRFRGCLLGLAIGDAVGTTVEFQPRGSFLPLTDLVGGGVFGLEAARWCFYQTSTFETAILQAANLGADADTTAAICGQIAGTYYGESAIPPRWRERLYMRDEINNLADKLSRLNI